MQGGIAAVDHHLGVRGDVPEAVAQIVVDIGGEVCDPVVEGLLPQRRLRQGVLGFGFAPLQFGGEPLPRARIVEHRQFTAHREREMFCGGADLTQHLVADPVVLP